MDESFFISDSVTGTLFIFVLLLFAFIKLYLDYTKSSDFLKEIYNIIKHSQNQINIFNNLKNHIYKLPILEIYMQKYIMSLYQDKEKNKIYSSAYANDILNNKILIEKILKLKEMRINGFFILAIGMGHTLSSLIYIYFKVSLSDINNNIEKNIGYIFLFVALSLIPSFVSILSAILIHIFENYFFSHVSGKIQSISAYLDRIFPNQNLNSILSKNNYDMGIRFKNLIKAITKINSNDQTFKNIEMLISNFSSANDKNLTKISNLLKNNYKYSYIKLNKIISTLEKINFNFKNLSYKNKTETKNMREKNILLLKQLANQNNNLISVLDYKEKNETEIEKENIIKLDAIENDNFKLENFKKNTENKNLYIENQKDIYNLETNYKLSYTIDKNDKLINIDRDSNNLDRDYNNYFDKLNKEIDSFVSKNINMDISEKSVENYVNNNIKKINQIIYRLIEFIETNFEEK